MTKESRKKQYSSYDRYIVYGEPERVQELCEQLAEFGVLPELILVNSPCSFTSYQGISVASSETICNVSASTDLYIVPAVTYHGEAVKEIIRVRPDLEANIIRDFDLLSCLCLERGLPSLPASFKPRAKIDMLIGMQMGFVMGGVETWISNLYHHLTRPQAHSQKLLLLEPLQKNPYHYVGADFYQIPEECVEKIGPYERFSEYVLAALQVIRATSPSIYVDNGSYRLLTAVWLAKKELGMNIKVISVLHGDARIVYRRLELFGDIIDRVIAVSHSILENVRTRFPNYFPEVYEVCQVPEITPPSESTTSANPLRLAYASRLEPVNKRSTWLIPILDELIKRKINFTLDVAGSGESFAPLNEYVSVNNLDEIVHLLGSLPHSQMNAFWKSHQVYLNFSVSEGGPLTLLEAMAASLVPVATDAGLGSILIQDGQNGFLIHSPQEAASAIEMLSHDPSMLAQLQQNTYHAIKQFKDSQYSLDELFSPKPVSEKI